MAINEPSVGGTLRELARQIQAIATRPFGHVTLKPGDGSLTTYTPSGAKGIYIGTDMVTLNVAGSNRIVSVMLDQLEKGLAMKANLSWVSSQLVKKAWTTYVDQVDANRVAGDKALLDKINQRATKSSVDAAISNLQAQIDAIRSSSSTAPTTSTSDGTTYTPTPTSNDTRDAAPDPYPDDRTPTGGDGRDPYWG